MGAPLMWAAWGRDVPMWAATLAAGSLAAVIGCLALVRRDRGRGRSRERTRPHHPSGQASGEAP